MGMKKVDVPRKKVRKKSILFNKLAFSMAPVKARRKGGQKLRPVANPAMIGSEPGHFFSHLWRSRFMRDITQAGVLLEKP